MREQSSEHNGEVAALVSLGPQLTPASISHAARPDLSWLVWQTLDSWRARIPRWFAVRGTTAVVERHRVLVAGPVPGRPGEYADYVLILSRYANSSGWWMRPEYVGR